MKISSSSRMYKELGGVLLVALGNRPQIWLAQRLFVSQVAVTHWLSGRSRPEPGRLGAIAALFDLSPNYLAWLAGYDYDCNPEAWEKVIRAYQDKR
jgi:hypothetical protein